MPPDSISATLFTNFKEWLPLVGAAIGILGGFAGLATAFFTKVLPWWRTKRDRRSLEKHFGADLYSAGIIERSTQYYIQPYCRSLDPAGAEEPRLVYGAKENLFDAVDGMLANPTEYRYLILLADSGMGKTSFLLNYYARHLRLRRRKFELALVPLGIPEVDKRIEKIKTQSSPKSTVLFLDALDEDTLAIVDHVARLRDLLELTRDFHKALITCRTQFFPKEEEIPKETGIVRIGPRSAGEKAQYAFHKLYLAPFTDEQVQQYLHQLYPVWKPQWRKRAQEMVDKIPNLSVRPMLLSHIDDLVRKGREITHTFELYEEMIEAWLAREEGIFPELKQEPLRQFSERLAVALYVNRKSRGGERIQRVELAPLASAWKIPLDDWQLSGRSLLNRDAEGNYKFAHRSIMEYLVVKRVVEGDPNCAGMEWTDLMKAFLQEVLQDSIAKKKVIDPQSPGLRGLQNVFLRPQAAPILREEEVKAMLKQHDLFDKDWHKEGKGIPHFYLLCERQGEKLVIDYATGLTWQQSGSSNHMTYSDAEKYVRELNAKRFAGYEDWRLPTLEEAMSLMEREKKNGDLYIDPVFDRAQPWIWTADKSSGSSCWVAYFDLGGCFNLLVGNAYYVRLVR